MNLAPHFPLVQCSATFVILADSSDIVLSPKSSKSDGYGGLLTVGVLFLAVFVTVIIFFRSRRKASESPQADDHQKDELGEPDDKGLKMK